MQLLTIGYEGLNGSEFFNLLNDAGVEVLVDVRELPLSRKVPFSKNALSRQAELHGLQYRHIQALGCPRPIRNEYRESKDWDWYSTHFLQYLSTQVNALEELKALSSVQRCCLMCYEADANFCHRLYVAQAVEALNGDGMPAIHLSRQMLNQRELAAAHLVV